MSKRVLRVRRWLRLFVLLSSVFRAAAQERVPVQAELVKVLEAGRVKAGDVLFAKVDAKWQGPQCTLRQGAIIRGRVVAQSPRSKTDKTSQIALLFESGQCDGPDLKPLPLTVAAVLAGDPRQEQNMYEYQPLSEAVGLSVGGSGGGSAGVGVGGGVSNSNMRSVLAAASTVYVSPPRYKGPTAVMPGQIIGIKGMKINVGGGPEGSSVLSTSGHNVRLESGSQLVLVPNLSVPAPGGASVVPAARASVAAATAKAADTIEVADETELCLPPQCSVAVPANEAENRASAAWTTLSLKDLGYVPVRADHEMYSFDYASAIAYLGAKELLFTFNPHVLIRRNGEEAKFAKLRIIRAVLINLQEKKVEKTLDWKVADAQQYLWSIGQDRALVHVSGELRLYGPGLKLERRLGLDGPLAFVRTSPASKYFAVGVVRERHSESVHRQLAEGEEREPEEDIEIKVLDGDFHVLATVMRSSRAAPPVLSDDGEIRVLSTSKNRWQIVEETWATQKRVLAHVNSACRPEAKTLPPNLLFVVGCDRQTIGKWYRVLQPNGTPVLKGVSPSAELEQTASGVATGNEFVIGMAEAAKSIHPDSAFRTSDLESEHIAVYRARNGERVFSVTVASPEPTVQTFVLSPEGDQLAVLQGDEIAFYEIPTAGGRR